MSGRTVPRFALAGLLAVALAAPAVAQQAEGGFQPPLNAEPTILLPNTALPEAPMPRAKDVLAFDALVYSMAQSAYFSDLIGSPDATDDAPKAEPVQPMVAPRSLEAAAPAPCCKPAAAGSVEDILVKETRTGSFILGESVNSDAGLNGLPTAQALMLPPVTLSIDDCQVQVKETRTGQFGSEPLAHGGRVTAAHDGLTNNIITTAPPCCGADCCRKSTIAVTEYKIDPVARVNSPRVIRTRVHLAASLLDERQFAAPPAPSEQVTPPVATTCGGIPQAQVSALGDSAQIQLVVVDEPAPAPGALPKAAANPLLGTWYRDLGISVIAVTFTPDEMKLCLTQHEGNNKATITITAHYTVTKDGLVFGAVTGADVDAKFDSPVEVGMELAEMSLMLQELADRPFSFRTKMTSAGMMVSQVKAASGDQIRGQELAALGGLFKFAKDGRVPTPVAKVPGAIGIRAEPAPRPVAVPPMPPVVREPLPRVGVDFDFNINVPVAAPQPRSIYRVEVAEPPLPVPPGGFGAPPRPVCNAGGPPAPIVSNDPTKGLAADAFGQLMQQSGVQRPDGTFVDGLPRPRVTGEACFPDRYSAAAAYPMTAPFVGPPTSGAVIAKPAHMGTWYRDIGPKRCVVKIEADHLTVTVSEAQDCDGQTVTGNLVFTADYQLGRDGMTAVGLIVSVDAKFDGDVPEDDMKAAMEMVADLQKALEEKPFAMTFRRYGDALVIGHVRMPEVGNSMELQPATYIGGRYKSVGDKPLSPLKAVKLSEPRPAPVCLPPVPVPPGAFAPPPPAGYGMPYPPVPRGAVMPVPYTVYPPPPSATPGDLLPPQAVPCPAPTRPVEYQAPPVPATRPTQPVTVPVPQSEEVPTMPMPRPMSAPIALPECSPTMSMPQPITLECPAAHAQAQTKGSLTLPSGRYLLHDPQYVAPDKAFPLPKELEEPEAATPQMTQPTPPGVSTRKLIPSVAASPKSGITRPVLNDPNIRMLQSLHESEDLRQMDNQWQRFWFPQRIHF